MGAVQVFFQLEEARKPHEFRQEASTAIEKLALLPEPSNLFRRLITPAWASEINEVDYQNLKSLIGRFKVELQNITSLKLITD